MAREKIRGKLILQDGGFIIVDMNSPIIPVDLEINGHIFKLSKDQDDPVFWIFYEKPPYRWDLH